MFALLALLVAAGSSPPSAAPAPLRADWELLGSHRVSFGAE